MRSTRTCKLLVSLSLIVPLKAFSSDATPKPQTKNPNILFVIMDDVGVDQMRSFGYGGPVAPKMPVIDTIANNGVRFRNTWSMPECSPGAPRFSLDAIRFALTSSRRSVPTT